MIDNYCYSYSQAGDIDLDDAEHWTVDSHEGKHLMGILTHEIGHSLGIAHSNVRDAVSMDLI